MSSWGRLVWFLVAAATLLAIIITIYVLSENPPPSRPVTSGPPLMDSPAPARDAD